MDIQKKLMIEFEGYPEPNECKRCKWCDEILIGTDSDYCSKDCEELYLMATGKIPVGTKTERLCIECGKALKGNQYRYCSKACKSNHYKKIYKRPRGNCAVCGKPITGNSYKYCSDECRRTGTNQLRREYKKKLKQKEGVCAICGKQIETKATKYCSKECRQQGEYMRRYKLERSATCNECGKPIKSGVFCQNDKCYYDWFTKNSVNEGRLSKCWICANYYKGCSWSRDFIPVTGWEAKEHKRDGFTSYKVINCPEFRRG